MPSTLYTQEDLDNVRRAISSGALRVRYHTGNEVQYRTLDELLRIEAEILKQLQPGRIRHIRVRHRSGFR